MRKFVCQAQMLSDCQKKRIRVQTFLRVGCQVELRARHRTRARREFTGATRVRDASAEGQRGIEREGDDAWRRVAARAASCRVRASAPNTRLALRYDSIAADAIVRRLEQLERARRTHARGTPGAPAGGRAMTRAQEMSARSASARARCTSRTAEQHDGIAEASERRARSSARSRLVRNAPRS